MEGPFLKIHVSHFENVICFHGNLHIDLLIQNRILPLLDILYQNLKTDCEYLKLIRNDFILPRLVVTMFQYLLNINFIA